MAVLENDEHYFEKCTKFTCKTGTERAIMDYLTPEDGFWWRNAYSALILFLMITYRFEDYDLGGFLLAGAGACR